MVNELTRGRAAGAGCCSMAAADRVSLECTPAATVAVADAAAAAATISATELAGIVAAPRTPPNPEFIALLVVSLAAVAAAAGIFRRSFGRAAIEGSANGEIRPAAGADCEPISNTAAGELTAVRADCVSLGTPASTSTGCSSRVGMTSGDCNDRIGSGADADDAGVPSTAGRSSCIGSAVCSRLLPVVVRKY